MRENDLCFGIIGCGRIAPRHAASIREIGGVRLAGVADIVESRAQRFVKDYGAENAVTDYRYLLDDPSIDVISICSPSGLHAQMALDAIAAGKNVICEKPMALRVEDADRMIEAAKSAGVLLCIMLQNRFNPPMQDLYEVVKQNRLGKILLGNATVRWYRPQDYYEDGWHGTRAMDGGALMNQSIHHIDALQWLMGEVDSVYAYTATLAHKIESEDVGVAVLRFKHGGLATIEGSTITYPENLEGSVALFGEHGSVKVGGTALNKKVIWKIDGELEKERDLLAREQLDPPSVYGYSHKKVITDVVTAIRENRVPLITGPEGRKSLELVLAIYESARTGQEVSFNL